MAQVAGPTALVDDLPVGDDTAQWPVWGTTARIIVTDRRVLDAARDLVVDELAAIDAACSRFRADSEIQHVARAAGEPVEVSTLLAELVAVALDAARRTDGRVDPTLGSALARLELAGDPASPLPDQLDTSRMTTTTTVTAVGWRAVTLDGRRLTVPAGVRLDFGATGKAHAADRCARLVADRLGTGVLVSLGGDLATAAPTQRNRASSGAGSSPIGGPGPDGGWRILVRDRPGEPACTVAIPPGTALATSSTIGRRWRDGDDLLHHILDPRTCRPAAPVWRTVTAVAATCVAANTLTTAAIVHGRDAVGWLRQFGVPARLVDAAGTVTTIGGWPA